MSAIVEFRGIGYSVPRAGASAPILQGLTFAVEPGETLVLLGRSGSGKTTALKMVNALVFPTTGEVLVEGRATTAWNPIELRRRIGYVIQETGLFPHFTVAENVAVVPRLNGWTGDRIDARVNELLARVGLPAKEYAGRYPRELSGGQRQRVGVARALAADPPILLFDEPFGSLDPVTRLELQHQLLDPRRDFPKTSIFVTHDVREALLVGTKIALLAGGSLELLTAPSGFRHSRSEEARGFLACLEN